MLQNTALMDRLHEKIDTLEQDSPDGFNRYIHILMATQLPRPQTHSWSR
ncbi:MAG: hypothetical protein R6U38_09070 [Desulfatiglandaceae bacterium]